jgi:hypothetical protein
MKNSVILAFLMCCTGFSNPIFAVEPTGDVTFQKLLKEFPQGKLPYRFTADALKHELLQQHGLEAGQPKSKVYSSNRLSIKYHSLLPDMVPFSRMARMPEPVMALESKTNYALIYMLYRYKPEYKVAIYDKEGHFLYKKVLAFAANKEIQAVVLDENLKATFSTYALVWEKEIEKEGFVKNAIQTVTFTKEFVMDMTIVPASEKKEPKESIPNAPKSPPAQSQKQPAIIRA